MTTAWLALRLYTRPAGTLPDGTKIVVKGPGETVGIVWAYATKDEAEAQANGALVVQVTHEPTPVPRQRAREKE